MECGYPSSLPPHTLPASLAGFVLHCLWFLSWSTADSPFFVRAALPCLPIGILINFYAVIGFFFLPHLHRLVLHHVEGNYTFIYYIASNIKPRKLYQRQQLFNHPSRDPFPKTIPLLHPGSHYSLKKADFQGLLHLWVLLGRVCAEVLVGELGNTMLPLRA